MNKLFIIGNLTRDPESRTNSNGKTVCNFSVAVNRKQKNQQGQQDADFFRVAAWGVTGENCQKYLTKGRKVAVTGSVSVHTYQAQDGTTKASMEVFAEEVEFLSPKGGESSGATPAADGGMTDVSGKEELPF